MATTEEEQAPPLLDLVERHPEFFEKEVLARVDPADRAFLGQVNSACRAAVLASQLPCAGTRLGMRWLNPASCALLAREVRARVPGSNDSTLAIELGYVSSSDVPRAGGVVRLELESATRLAWAKARGCRWDEWICALVAKSGHLEVLQWARKYGCPWDKRTSQYAAEGGHLEMLQWARARGCPWHEWCMCSYAAKRGHLKVLIWLREHGGCPLGFLTCRDAASNGQLAVLKWLRENGCDWDGSTCLFAAMRGHLEMLQWAREHDCPWAAGVCELAAEGGHLAVLRWARAHGCPWDKVDARAAAAEGRHYEVLRWMDEHGE
jgi:hypothetical protein